MVGHPDAVAGDSHQCAALVDGLLTGHCLGARMAYATGCKAAWKALKASTTPEQLAAAYKAMNIRDDDDE